ncbi:MAG TPA: hypothetical protein VE645_08315 [Pseudonocardiaceae bacterium]|nr:hypothetical protein [Pseudonocardiaceae bacterium]
MSVQRYDATGGAESVLAAQQHREGFVPLFVHLVVTAHVADYRATGCAELPG